MKTRQLTATERIAKDRNVVLSHYQNAIDEILDQEQLAHVAENTNQLTRGVRALMEDRGYFEPTAQDHKDAENPALSDTYLQDTFERAKTSTVRDVVALFNRFSVN